MPFVLPIRALAAHGGGMRQGVRASSTPLTRSPSRSGHAVATHLLLKAAHRDAQGLRCMRAVLAVLLQGTLDAGLLEGLARRAQVGPGDDGPLACP